MALLTASGLCKSFYIGRGKTVHAVKDVSLKLDKSECLAIIGESGSGKSTLGRILLGLIEPDRGEIVLEEGSAAKRQRIQAVFQEPYQSLNPRHRILSIVREPLDINRRAMSRSDRDAEARKMLELVGLPHDLHDRLPHNLSGGQQQRVGIARALILGPEMLVLDEPTSSLDVSVRAQILELLGDLKRRRGISMLYISHDIGSVETIADRVAVMYRGEIMESGETASLLSSPVHPYTKMLLSARLVPDPDVPPAPMIERFALGSEPIVGSNSVASENAAIQTIPVPKPRRSMP